jgi:hypothetical protein
MHVFFAHLAAAVIPVLLHVVQPHRLHGGAIAITAAALQSDLRLAAYPPARMTAMISSCDWFGFDTI